MGEPHLVTIRSFILGRFGCFYFLGTTNKTAVKILVEFFHVDIFSFPWMNVRSVVTGLLGKCVCHVQETVKLFSGVAVPFHISTSNTGELRLL